MLWQEGGLNFYTKYVDIQMDKTLPGTSCWKGGSYLPMPGGLQCSMHYFPPPVNYLSQYDPGC